MSDLQKRRLQLESILKGATQQLFPHRGYVWVNDSGRIIPEKDYQSMRVELAMAVLGMTYTPK